MEGRRQGMQSQVRGALLGRTGDASQLPCEEMCRCCGDCDSKHYEGEHGGAHSRSECEVRVTVMDRTGEGRSTDVLSVGERIRM